MLTPQTSQSNAKPQSFQSFANASNISKPCEHFKHFKALLHLKHLKAMLRRLLGEATSTIMFNRPISNHATANHLEWVVVALLRQRSLKPVWPLECLRCYF